MALLLECEKKKFQKLIFWGVSTLYIGPDVTIFPNKYSVEFNTIAYVEDRKSNILVNKI